MPQQEWKHKAETKVTVCSQFMCLTWRDVKKIAVADDHVQDPSSLTSIKKKTINLKYCELKTKGVVEVTIDSSFFKCRFISERIKRIHERKNYFSNAISKDV